MMNHSEHIRSRFSTSQFMMQADGKRRVGFGTENISVNYRGDGSDTRRMRYKNDPDVKGSVGDKSEKDAKQKRRRVIQQG